MLYGTYECMFIQLALITIYHRFFCTSSIGIYMWVYVCVLNVFSFFFFFGEITKIRREMYVWTTKSNQKQNTTDKRNRNALSQWHRKGSSVKVHFNCNRHMRDYLIRVFGGFIFLHIEYLACRFRFVVAIRFRTIIAILVAIDVLWLIAGISTCRFLLICFRLLILLLCSWSFPIMRGTFKVWKQIVLLLVIGYNTTICNALYIQESVEKEA